MAFANNVEEMAVQRELIEGRKVRLAIVAYHARAAGIGNALCALVARLDDARFEALCDPGEGSSR